MSTSASSPGFFEEKYQRSADPWNFTGSTYELSRYESIIEALSHRRYAHAFEPGCSVGVLTERLASICDAVEAIDFSATAVDRARERCAHQANVEVCCRSLPERLPVQGFDLIVLSEIGYYFSPAEWGSLTADLVAPMLSETTLLAAHWLGESKDHRMGGDDVHEILMRNALLRLEHSERHAAFRLDRWIRI